MLSEKKKCTGVSVIVCRISPVIQASVNFVKFQLTFSQLILAPNTLKLCRVTKVKVLFLFLVSVFHSVQF